MKCFPVAEMTSKDYLTSVVVIRFGEGHIDAIISKVGRIAPEEVLLHFITLRSHRRRFVPDFKIEEVATKSPQNPSSS